MHCTRCAPGSARLACRHAWKMTGFGWQRQHEEAKRSGRFIDLTEVDENDEEIKKARVVIKSEILEEAEQEKREVQAAVDKEHKKRRAEVVRACSSSGSHGRWRGPLRGSGLATVSSFFPMQFEAEEQVKEAEELLAKVRVELEECDRQVKGQGQLAGNKRLRKCVELLPNPRAAAARCVVSHNACSACSSGQAEVTLHG